MPHEDRAKDSSEMARTWASFQEAFQEAVPTPPPARPQIPDAAGAVAQGSLADLFAQVDWTAPTTATEPSAETHGDEPSLPTVAVTPETAADPTESLDANDPVPPLDPAANPIRAETPTWTDPPMPPEPSTSAWGQLSLAEAYAAFAPKPVQHPASTTNGTAGTNDDTHASVHAPLAEAFRQVAHPNGHAKNVS